MNRDADDDELPQPPPFCASCGARALFILNGVMLCGACLFTEPWVSDLFTLVNER